MKKLYFSPERDGFYGAYYPTNEQISKTMIVMLGDDIDDMLVKSAVRWLHTLGCHVMALAPAKKDYGHHSYPIERIEKAVSWLKAQGSQKIGICGASTTGMLALVSASLIPDIRLTLAFTPCDFVMEGFYRDGLDGVRERPGDYESSLSYRGKQLPFLPYAYRHPEYWQKIQEESKRRHDIISSRDLFDESERLHPLQEEETIKVENIHGRLVLIGAEDDSLWDTCRYIRRIDERLKSRPHKCRYRIMTYEHGSHFCFPQSMIESVLPIGSGLALACAFESLRDFPIESRQMRVDLDKKLSYLIYKW